MSNVTHTMARGLPMFLAVVLSGFRANAPVMAQCQEQWVIPSEWDAYAAGEMVVFDDGNGNALYIVARYPWNAPTGNVFKWDGTTSSVVGSGMNANVWALAEFDDGSGPALYAGGLFTIAGGIGANHIAKWNGTSWSALGSGVDGGNVYALAVYDDGSGPALYAGGDFTMAGGVSANRVAKWNGTSWSPMGIGVSHGHVQTMAVYDDGAGPALYIGGMFTSAGSATANRVAKWDGLSWSGLGSGMNLYNAVSDLAVFDGGDGHALYIAGSFITNPGNVRGDVAIWNGADWSILAGSDLGNPGFYSVFALGEFYDAGGPALYVGGRFPAIGGVNARNIAKWDGTSWSALDSGMNEDGYVYGLAVFDDGNGPAIYATGSFNTAGGMAAERVATWQVNCPPPAVLAADPSDVDKCRAISFVPPADPDEATAMRVTLSSLHHVEPPYTSGPSTPFTGVEGQARWVGPPVQHVESTSNATPFYASSLQCTPHYQDWSTVGLLHVTGSAIVPSSVYEVENVSILCTGVETNCTAVSEPLTVKTTRWGDVELPYSPPSPTTQPDLGDVAALVNKFEAAPTAPIKARALLAGTDAFGNVNLGVDVSFDSIAACVDAFRGKPYPYTISSCP